MVVGISERVITGEPVRVPLAEIIKSRAADEPDGLAIVASSRSWTNRDLVAVAGWVAGQVADSAGSAAAPLVAVAAPTRSLLAVTVVASAAVSPTAPMPLDLPADRRDALLQRLRPATVIDAAEMPALDASIGTFDAWADFDSPAFILTTSGSTAEPKVVPNTHRNLWASARFASQAQELGPGDRCLALGSMAHVLGLRTVTDALWCGAHVIVPDELTVGELAELLRRHFPTCVIAPPPLLHTLAAAVESLTPDERDHVDRSLRYIRSGAAALRHGLVERLQANLGAAILHGYGMSEVAKIACTPLHGGAPAGSVGQPLGVELRIDAVPNAPDSVGEIVVRGDVVAPGYFDQLHESASGFENGWFRTGDLGRLDANGNLFLTGRKDDVVSRGGVLISLDSLENVLEAHPGVRAAVAAGLDHPSLGVDVVLGFVRNDGAVDVDVTALRDFLGAHFPASQVPTRIVEVDEIPLASSGKPSRAGFLDMVEASRPHAARLSSKVPDPKLDGIELRLAAMWCDLLLLDTAVLPDDNLFALGADSLHLVELCTMVAAAFDIEVLPGELIGRPTLDDMAALIRESAGRTERATLVPLRAGGSDRVPLYVVPGAGGTLAAVHRFVFGLEAGRRVLGFEGLGLFSGEEELTSTRQLAERYVDELLADAGDGAYVLVGMSFGSVVAQEMTRLLELRGNPPDLLVMFDCPPPGVKFRPKLRSRLVAKVLRTYRKAKPPTQRVLARIHRQALISDEVRANHRAGPISTSTLLFTSRANRRRAGDPLLGWAPLINAPIATVRFPGVHLELIRERAAETGAALDVRLIELDARVAHGPSGDRSGS